MLFKPGDYKFNVNRITMYELLVFQVLLINFHHPKIDIMYNLINIACKSQLVSSFTIR